MIKFLKDWITFILLTSWEGGQAGTSWKEYPAFLCREVKEVKVLLNFIKIYNLVLIIIVITYLSQTHHDCDKSLGFLEHWTLSSSSGYMPFHIMTWHVAIAITVTALKHDLKICSKASTELLFQGISQSLVYHYLLVSSSIVFDLLCVCFRENDKKLSLHGSACSGREE